MVKAVKDKKIYPRIRVEGDEKINYAVSCRHCTDPLCVKSCIAGAISLKDGAVFMDKEKCVGCLTCILVCPYGAVARDKTGTALKCELCLKNSLGQPACVTGCPNAAIVYEER
jgi:carbon-monoxide dehydrogenase iron sulfur subunit